MSGIDSSVTCHQLNINLFARYISQQRMWKSPKNVESSMNTIHVLFDAKLISIFKYTWISNFVLVKKAAGKWNMCANYTDLNRACQKDSYPLPNINEQVDTSKTWTRFRSYSMLTSSLNLNILNEFPMPCWSKRLRQNGGCALIARISTEHAKKTCIHFQTLKKNGGQFS